MKRIKVNLEKNNSIKWMRKELQTYVLGGGGHNSSVLPNPLLIKSKEDYVLEKSGINAHIYFGKDRPSSLISGYGGLGYEDSSTIDIVVGKHGNTKNDSLFSPVNPSSENKIYVDPDFFLDSSRIYISQKTDIDKNFGIIQSRRAFVGNILGKPAVGIKSNSVRLVGEEGIKLVTGTTNTGDKIPAGIELIAMNSDKSIFEVQPMAKGGNMKEALEDLQQQLFALNGILLGFIQEQERINKTLENHNHISSSPGATTSPPALGTIGNFNSRVEILSSRIRKLKGKTKKQAKVLINWQNVWMNPSSDKYVLSRYNGCN